MIGVSRLLKLLRWFLKIKNWNIWWLLVLYLLSDDATYFNHFKEGRKEWMSGRSVGPSGVLAGVLFGGTAVCVVQRSVQVYSMPMAILSESGFSAAPHIGCVPPPCCWLRPVSFIACLPRLKSGIMQGTGQGCLWNLGIWYAIFEFSQRNVKMSFILCIYISTIIWLPALIDTVNPACFYWCQCPMQIQFYGPPSVGQSVGRFGRSLVLGIAWWANLHERIVCESILMQKGDVMLEGTGRYRLELEVSPL